MNKKFEEINTLINTKILGKSVLKADFETFEIIDKISLLSKDLNNNLSFISFNLPKEYYAAVDKRIRKTIKNENIACKLSCSKCCKNIHFLVPILEIDNMVIALNKINDVNIKKEIGKKIENLYNEFKVHKTINTQHNLQEVTDKVEYFQSLIDKENNIHYDCPFLINEKYSIYEDRPVVCRTYISKLYENCLNDNADFVIHEELIKRIGDLNFHPKNKLLPADNGFINMSVPFYIIKYNTENNKFYSINKFSYWLQTQKKK